MEVRFTQTSFQILTGEAPGERFAQGGVPLSELGKAVLQLLQAGAVVGSEHFTLDDCKIDFDLIEPTGVFRRVDDDDARVTCAEFLGGAFVAM